MIISNENMLLIVNQFIKFFIEVVDVNEQLEVTPKSFKLFLFLYTIYILSYFCLVFSILWSSILGWFI